MAITRAQQAKQMLQNGGRIGLKPGGPPGGGATSKGSGRDYSGSTARERGAEKSRKEAQRRSDIRSLVETGLGSDVETGRGTDPETGLSRANLESIQSVGVGRSDLPGVLGIGLNATLPFRRFTLEKNKEYFTGLKSRGAAKKYPPTADGYRQYMSDRLAGKIDAAGNPIMGGDDDNNNMFLPVASNATLPEFDVPGDKDTTEQDEDLRLAFRADGGRIGAMNGGIMNSDVVGGEFDFESARQMYGLGKLVKKVTRTVKKIAKSPIGKAAIAAATIKFGGPLAARFAPGTFGSAAKSPFLRAIGRGQFFGDTGIFSAGKNLLFGTDAGIRSAPGLLDKFPGGGVGALITGTSIAAGVLTPEQEDQAQQLADKTGFSIEEARNSILQAAKENYAMDFRARGFKADGGLMRLGYQEGSKEPVAKKTMPLLDMGGKEMDLREDGGFVPIGRMEKADDVPARLSKNEFVFTADAVRNAGDGDVDKGAEVMYNMMKNLEAGGEVSEESQGLEGARRMFQTSQRLEEVL